MKDQRGWRQCPYFANITLHLHRILVVIHHVYAKHLFLIKRLPTFIALMGLCCFCLYLENDREKCAMSICDAYDRGQVTTHMNSHMHAKQIDRFCRILALQALEVGAALMLNFVFVQRFQIIQSNAAVIAFDCRLSFMTFHVYLLKNH